jgi:hypothetical protein
MRLCLPALALLCGLPQNVALAPSLTSDVAPDTTLRRQSRWDAAAATVVATIESRRRYDHRAHMARLMGVYVSDDSVPKSELLLVMQPDQGGRKLLFLDPDGGATLGFIELETLDGAQTKTPHAHDAEPTTSVLRGMLVAEGSRGKGYARLFLAMWLGLCTRAGVTPATSRINKPLLALTLVRLGFTPLRGRHKPGLRGKPGKSRKPRQRPLAVEVSVGEAGEVLLYCPLPTEAARLHAGFSATELRSQRLHIAAEPPLPRGRVAHIRVRYAPPRQAAATHLGCHQKVKHEEEQPSTSTQMVHAPLAEAAIGGRLRLFATQGPANSVQTSAERAEVLRLLTGNLLAPTEPCSI